MKKQQSILKKHWNYGFFFGLVLTSFSQVVMQDLLGQERYLELTQRHWVDFWSWPSLLLYVCSIFVLFSLSYLPLVNEYRDKENKPKG